MTDKNDGGDKTEKPTPKRLRDARDRGDVPKSREVTSTVGLVGWIVVGAIAMALAGDRLGGLFESAFQMTGDPSPQAMLAVGSEAFATFVVLTAAILVPVALLGMLVEFLQTGPVLTVEKIKPRMEHLDPVVGLKRIFSMDNLVEVAKALVKTALLLLIAWIVTDSLLDQILMLPSAPIDAFGAALWQIALQLLAWTVVVFVLVSVLDAAYQRFSFTKKLRMSRRDIRQETKDTEGDPFVKAQRRQLHQEWAQRNASQAAQDATALVVNPTHISIALLYDPDLAPVPAVTAKGEDLIALAMREAAHDAGVPVLRNVDLARALHERVALDDVIPSDLFDAVAQVIVWAREQRVAGAPAPEAS